MQTLAWFQIRPNRRQRRWCPARAGRRLLLEKLENRLALAADFLYVADASSTGDTVQRFDATTGEYLGSFVAAGSLLGPRGLVFDASGSLLAVNQNVNQPFAGEVLRYDGKTGAPLPALVPTSNPQAPFAPRGIVVRDNTLYVADINQGSPSGRIAKYNATTGAFLGNLVPNGFTGEFSPRGLVFGPDGALYVSVFNQTLHDTNDPAGYVLRFQDTTSGAFQVVAGNNGDGAFQAGEIADLHNPEGIVFGPDGRLYVTSDRANFSDTDKILVLDPQTHSLKDKIVLDQVGQERTYSPSILFGPDGKLFVSIQGEVSGSVRRYDVTTKAFDVFVAPGFYGPLYSPWYMALGHMRQDTLAYDTEWNPWHNAADPYDVDGQNGVEALDALLIINYLNTPNSRWPEPPAAQTVPPRYYDVSGGSARVDIEPLDVLKVINYLNRSPVAAGEGERVSAAILVSFPQLARATPASAPAPSVVWAEQQTTDDLQPMRKPGGQAIDRPAANPAATSPADGGLPIQNTSLLPADIVWTDDSASILEDVVWCDDLALLSALADDVDRVWQLG